MSEVSVHSKSLGVSLITLVSSEIVQVTADFVEESSDFKIRLQ